MSLIHPNFPENDVTYEYGGPDLLGQPGNRVGRVTAVIDESGTETRMYGKLGEIVEETKTIASDTGDPDVYTTAYLFDTWGRLQQLTYPDGEVLTYSYDSGGLPRAASGLKDSVTTDYVTRLEYDKFEQRVFMKMGNGVETTQTYDPLDRRPATIKAGTFQDVSFLYDDVGNITDVNNNVPPAPQNTLGGKVTQHFVYDGLYRLTNATGSWQYEPEKNDQYSLMMSYDKIHNITHKTQTHTVTKGGKDPKVQAKTTYDWAYAYAGPHPHAPTTIGDRTFAHDLNGNQTGWQDPNNSQDRAITWDEENRIQSIADNGSATTFKYNDAGERVIKSGSQGETAYVNQFWTVRNKTVPTKHIFVGSSRLVSKVTPSSGNGSEAVFFYHADHLGSTSFVTDQEGELAEHAQYFPFGEPWVLQQASEKLPYLFTSKELDEETGLYYFGARYLDPRTSVWQSADPILGAYLDGMSNGGVYAPVNLSLYTYAWNNPIRLVDHMGLDPSDPWYVQWAKTVVGMAYGTAQLLAPGGAATDVVGVPTTDRDFLQGKAIANIGGGLALMGGGGVIAGGGTAGSGGTLAPVAVPVGVAVMAQGASNVAAGVNALVLLSMGGSASSPPPASPPPGSPPPTAKPPATSSPATTSPPAAPPVAQAGAELTKQQIKAIGSLEKQIAQHEQKLAQFKANPTPRPGTEKLSKEIQQRSIEGRIKHLEREIQTFKGNIEKIRRGEQ